MESFGCHCRGVTGKDGQHEKALSICLESEARANRRQRVETLQEWSFGGGAIRARGCALRRLDGTRVTLQLRDVKRAEEAK